MTPEEKAFELVERYYEEVKYSIDQNDRVVNNVARQCAIICVEEIIDYSKRVNDDYDDNFMDGRISYWNEVLAHLKNKK